MDQKLELQDVIMSPNAGIQQQQKKTLSERAWN